VSTITRGLKKPEPVLDERQLIKEVLEGNAAAERQLYEAHVDRVYRLACRLTGDPALAEDLTQDTFIRAFDRLDDFRGDGPFGGWLHRIATSVIYSALRKRKRLQEHESTREDLARFSPPAAERDPDLKRRIDRAVAGLDENHRLVFVMHDLEGFTHQEIAAAMDTPVGTAKARLSRARGKLREILTGSSVTDLSMEME
jgi:RNA polymerase sigma-70 factor (ECF subfamily)